MIYFEEENHISIQMSSGSCNGLCVRHPKRTKKRIQLVNFDITKDAVCRQCECYYKDMPETNKCPCCHRRLSRRLTTMRSFKKRMHAVLKKLIYNFRDFWEMITRQYRPRKKKDMSGRRCLLCNSKKTQVHKCGTPIWLRYLHGYVCLNCHVKKTRRIKSFARCPLNTFLLSP